MAARPTFKIKIENEPCDLEKGPKKMRYWFSRHPSVKAGEVVILTRKLTVQDRVGREIP
jgi:hypothetical protein